MYHPDVTGTNETAEQYRAAFEAYKILQDYNENFSLSDVKIDNKENSNDE